MLEFRSAGNKERCCNAVLDLLQNELTVGMAILENEGYDKSQAGYQPENNELCCVCLDDNEYAW